jgi:D(-)-tartrate dehydratase
MMKIKKILELTIPIHSTQRNSRFDFSKMNTSVVAVVSDVIRNGKPLVGYAFNSFGRYGCGALLRERFIPKILDAPAESLLNDAQDNFDAAKIMNCLLARDTRSSFISNTCRFF